MRKYFLVGGLLACLGLCGGCGPEVADPVDSEFQGEDLENQMEAMEQEGRQEAADLDKPAGEAQ